MILRAEAAAATQRFQLAGRDALTLRADPDVDVDLCDLQVGGNGNEVRTEFEILWQVGLVATRTGRCLQLRPDAVAADPQVALQFTGSAKAKIIDAGHWHDLMRVALVLGAIALAWLVYLQRSQLHAVVERLPLPPAQALLLRHLHWPCAVLLFGFGIAYLALTPPGAVADEEGHLAKILRVAHGVPMGSSGDMLLPDTRRMYGPFTNYPENKAPFAAAEVRRQAQAALVCAPTTSQLSRGADGYSPLPYLLPAALYRIGCASGYSFGWFLYVARAMNLLLCIALATWGIAIASRGKVGLALVALLPMSLFQMASLSADAMVIALSLAWLGLVSAIASGTRRPENSERALWLMSLAVALLKPGSAWILAALLLCRPAYSASGRSFAVAAAKFVAFPLLIHVFLTLQAAGQAPVLAGVDPKANIALLANDPLAVLGMIYTTLVGRASWLSETLVGLLGWLDVPLSQWAYSVAGVLFIASLAGNEPAPLRLAWYARASALVMASGSFVLLALPLFLYWTTTASPHVQGLQGRYFLPTAAFLLMWWSIASPPALRGWLALLVMVGAAAINADGVHQVYQAYYVTGR